MSLTDGCNTTVPLQRLLKKSLYVQMGLLYVPMSLLHIPVHLLYVLPTGSEFTVWTGEFVVYIN